MREDVHDVEVLRRRWRLARERVGLLDPLALDFGTGGLARLAPGVWVRVLILPPDPEAVVVEFDEDFWQWLGQDRANPFGGRPTDWGRQTRPTADAAARYERYKDDPWEWERYLAVYRHGGIECGMGREVAGVWGRRQEGPGVKVFRLIPIIGRLWCILALYSEAVNRYALTGPWELSLGLRQTHGSVFGNVGAGWAEPTDFGVDEPRTCPDPNILIRREVEEWPEEDGIRDLTFLLGAEIEDAWGVRQRRFLARVGDDAGTFDTSRYG